MKGENVCALVEYNFFTSYNVLIICYMVHLCVNGAERVNGRWQHSEWPLIRTSWYMMLYICCNDRGHNVSPIIITLFIYGFLENGPHLNDVTIILHVFRAGYHHRQIPTFFSHSSEITLCDVVFTMKRISVSVSTTFCAAVLTMRLYRY